MMKIENSNEKILHQRVNDCYQHTDIRHNNNHEKLIKLEHAKESDDINYLNNKQYSRRYYELYEKCKVLPIFNKKEKITKKIKKYQSIIIVGDTGCGKTTQIPHYIIENKLNNGKKVIVCQPRRIAAISLASRVAKQLDVNCGEEVGYQIRFKNNTTSHTVLKFVTTDEAHERTLETDMILALLKTLCKNRKDLKIIIMSATIDYNKFIDYFNAKLIKISGQSYPVEIIYENSPVSNYLNSAVDKVVKIHYTKPPGDILVFLPGEEDIETVYRRLETMLDSVDTNRLVPIILPLYSALPKEKQEEIFKGKEYFLDTDYESRDIRKIILATNIAETSITIDTIVYIIDSGFCKQKVFNPLNKTENLVLLPISKSSAIQRMGRAGRVQNGICYRLYTEETYKTELKEKTTPEIHRCNLTSLILSVLRTGVTNFYEFDFFDAPAAESIIYAFNKLHTLNAINTQGNLTEIGKIMCEFPLDPCYSSAIIASANCNALNHTVALVSVLSVQNVFTNDKQKKYSNSIKRYLYDDSDHLSLLNIFINFLSNNKTKQWALINKVNYRILINATKIYEQLIKICCNTFIKLKIEKFNDSIPRINIMKILINAFKDQIAATINGKIFFKLPECTQYKLHPNSNFNCINSFVIYNDILITKEKYIKIVSKISVEQLKYHSEEYYNYLVCNIKNDEIVKLLKLSC